MITVGDALAQGRQMLMQAEGKTAQLDTRVLLAHLLGIEQAMLYAYPERELRAEQEQQFLALVERRGRGEPVAYLVGHKEFYGLDFLVDRHVLIPEPETEMLVETALGILRNNTATVPIVADIATGSGAIAITLAVEEPRLPYLYAADISREALAVAHMNCQRHAVEQRVRLLHGDLLAPLPEPVDLLIANLPYLGTDEIGTLTPDVYDYEPHLALFSGPHGLDLFQRFLREAQQSDRVKKGAVILLEIGNQQHEPVRQMIGDLWPHAHVTCKKDYAHWDRMLLIHL